MGRIRGKKEVCMGEVDLDIVVIGAIGIDTSVFLQGQDIDLTVEANFTRNVDYVGQAGGYCSRGWAQLGYQTGFIGFIGDDGNGQCVRNALACDGIEAILFVDPAGTRRSVNFMYQDGRRKNFYDGRGAMSIEPDLEVCGQMLRRTRLAHFNIENWARYLLPLAQEADLVISCDIQDLVLLDDPYRRDFIVAADVLFFSAVNFPDPSEITNRLLKDKPDQIIIVGMGHRGCMLATRQEQRFFEPVSFSDPVVDTNGAGDGLAVGFLSSYYLNGYSLEDALLRGQIVARYTCTQQADTDHLMNRSQLESYFVNLKDHEAGRGEMAESKPNEGKGLTE
jgi:acarbose 7IV-phosphotransferase